MQSLKERLQYFVDDFHSWIANNHAPNQYVDDPSYPNWHQVNKLYYDLFAQNAFSSLDKEAQTNLLYLIARGDDSGDTLINWLDRKGGLSSFGNLQRSDFMLLAHTLTTLTHSDFSLAKTQFASSFRKLAPLDDEMTNILLKFFESTDYSVKIYALSALADLKYNKIEELVAQTWKTTLDWHISLIAQAKMVCLDILDNEIRNVALTKTYLSIADPAEGKYLARYLEKLRKRPLYREDK